ERRNRFAAYLNEKIAYGSVTPAQKDVLVKLRDALDGVSLFSAAHPDCLEDLNALVDLLPRQIHFTTQARRQAGDPPAARPSPRDLAAAITVFRDEQAARGVEVSHAEAIKHITSNPSTNA